MAASNAVRVLCVDDHAVLIEGLKAQFAIDGSATVVGSLSSAEKLLDEVARLKPDVILLDIEMPGPDVFEMADRLSHARPDAKFIFLSAHIRDTFLSAAYECGASGYFAKSDNVDDIVKGIHELARAARGTFIMSPKVKERCGITPATNNASGDDTLSTRTSKLTPREIEIVRLVGKGLSRVEIAKELSRSAKTIDGHQERILRKLNLESRADLVRYAIREGYAQA
jgi:two-component system response regulator NreC